MLYHFAKTNASMISYSVSSTVLLFICFMGFTYFGLSLGIMVRVPKGGEDLKQTLGSSFLSRRPSSALLHAGAPMCRQEHGSERNTSLFKIPAGRVSQALLPEYEHGGFLRATCT